MATPATIALIRFREPDINVLPSDDVGSLGDLNVDTGLALPPVVSAFTGFGRQFSDGFALDGVDVDVVPGSTLATRDVTVQALLSWDFAGQNTYAQTGTIVARGKGNAAAEYVSYALELRVVNAALGIGELRWWWQDSTGAVKTQIGGQFIVPSSGFVLLTAVRHWVSSSSVELRYYVGERLVGEFLSADGDIGGGTTGTFCLGTRYSAGAPARFFNGILDEVRVLNYELTAEEIAATWNRISVLQPRGYKAIRDLVPPGAPISNDPSSRVQKVLRIAGHAIGYAAAQAENIRANLMPDRAYGPTLAQWEGAVGEAPKAPDTAPTRRKRVIGHLAQRAGTSIPGVRATVADMLALAQSQVQVLAFDQTTRDDFSAGLKAERWWATPIAQWTIAANALRVQNVASIPYDGKDLSGLTALQAIGADGRAARVLAKLVPTTLAATSEVGVVLYNWAPGPSATDAFLLGLRFDGSWRIVTETFRDGISQGGPTVQSTLGGMPAALWLHLWQVDPGGGGNGFGTSATTANYLAAWSTTSQIAGYTTAPPIVHRTKHQWAGLYARTIGGAANIDVSFDDALIRAPFGGRSSRWYVFRDPTLPGAADLQAGHGAIQRLKHAHIGATVITAKSLLCDDVNSGCDRGPMGAL